MYTGIGELGIKKFQAKINLDNNPSIALFQKKLGFTEVRSYDYKSNKNGY